MATYKVIQDIEAEDKFVGPLTLKQFIFAMFGSLFAYLSFFVVSRGLVWGLIGTLPPTLFGFFMAFPWSSEQPTDVWVLAKIRFRIKPKKRIWDQAGRQELVTITAPKKIEKPKTKNLSETEVRSRLKALAETIDSRGWIVKNVGYASQPAASDQSSDRLLSPETVPEPAVEADAAIPDMMEDERGLDSMIMEHDQARKAEIYEKMDMARYGEPLDPPEPAVLPPAPVNNAYDEQSLSNTLKAKRADKNIATGNMHTISAASDDEARAQVQDGAAGPDDDVASIDEQKTEVEKAGAPMTEPLSPDILRLAESNDLNVSTIARQANKKADKEPNEIVVSLH
ncbi:MAG TPA: PrgI family protein [Candidatus Saccharimonadales bacterium]|nr:PrgI family protein [Candidatus Saccharimonadales bacterium]